MMLKGSMVLEHQWYPNVLNKWSSWQKTNLLLEVDECGCLGSDSSLGQIEDSFSCNPLSILLSIEKTRQIWRLFHLIKNRFRFTLSIMLFWHRGRGLAGKSDSWMVITYFLWLSYTWNIKGWPNNEPLLFWNTSLVSLKSLRGHMAAVLYSRKIKKYLQLHPQYVWACGHILTLPHGSGLPLWMTCHYTSLATNPIYWLLPVCQALAYIFTSNPQINNVK